LAEDVVWGLRISSKVSEDETPSTVFRRKLQNERE
jgi:hypothetical protein